MAKHDLASRQQRIYTERYQWPLALALGLLFASLLVGTRRRMSRKPAVSNPKPKSARPKFAVQGAAVLLAATLLAPGIRAEDTVASAEKAYKNGEYAKAQKEYAAAAKSDPKHSDLEFNAGTAAYKAGQFQPAAEAFQKSIGAQQSADSKRLAAQEDAFYNLGNTLYRDGQATVQSDPKKTIPKWEEAIKTYEGALQLHPTDADAKYNRDFVKRKLEELKKKQEQQKKDQQGKDEQKKDQQSKDQENKGQQPQPAKASPQGKNQAAASPDQRKDEDNQAADSQREPGQMSKEEARTLLDSLKGEERRLPTALPARSGNAVKKSDHPIKDW
jgi:Ca-activated chloride channel family protein